MLQWTWQILVNARMMKIIRKELKTQAGTTFSYFETIGKVRQVKNGHANSNCSGIYPGFVEFKHIDSLLDIVGFLSVVVPFNWSLLTEVMMFTTILILEIKD